MTKENADTIKMLCGYARNRKQVIKSFADSYPEVPKLEIEKAVNKYWLTVQTERSTLAGQPLKAKILILRNLLLQKEIGEIKRIELPIVSDIRKKLPKDLYDIIIRETSPGREKVRGKYAELIGISNDGIKLVVSHGGEYVFTIYDINCSKKIILI